MLALLLITTLDISHYGKPAAELPPTIVLHVIIMGGSSCKAEVANKALNLQGASKESVSRKSG